MYISSSPHTGPPAPDRDEPVSHSGYFLVDFVINTCIQVSDGPVTPSKPDAPTHQQRLPAYATKQKPQQRRTFAEMELGNGNGADEIQDFEEQQSAGPSGSGGRKRHATDIEPMDDAEVEQPENRRKATGKVSAQDMMGSRADPRMQTKKGSKVADPNVSL
jgi:hypothetical protein